MRDKATNTLITSDLDGPSVVTVGGALLMAFNTFTTGNPASVRLAEPLDPSDLAKGWNSWPLPPQINALGTIDDPTLGPDGLVLVLAVGGADNDLWVSRRASTSTPFGQPTPLASVNSLFSEASPYIVAAPLNKLELFFISDRGGQQLVYHTICTL